MAKIESWLHCDLKKAVQVQELKGNVFSLDNNGSRIRVKIFSDGEKATVSGTVTAKCILADDSTVNVNGSLATVDGQSVASVDIPQGCLLVPGTIRIAIKLTDSSVITTLAAVISTVYRTSTDNVITPSAQIIADWNQEISDALAAQDAQIEIQDGKIDDLKSAISNTLITDAVIHKIRTFANSDGTSTGTKRKYVQLDDNRIKILSSATGDTTYVSVNLFGSAITARQGSYEAFTTYDSDFASTSIFTDLANNKYPWILHIMKTTAADVSGAFVFISKKNGSIVSRGRIATSLNNTDYFFDLMDNIGDADEFALYITLTNSTYCEGQFVFEFERKYTDTIIDELNRTKEYNASFIENGGFEQASGKVDSTKRIRTKQPMFVGKGYRIKFNIGSLYAAVWELSSDSTSGGNLLLYHPWAQYTECEIQNDCWLFITFATASTSSESSAITVDDFTGYFQIVSGGGSVAQIWDEYYFADDSTLNAKIAQYSALLKTDAGIDSFMFFTDPHVMALTNWTNEFGKMIRTMGAVYDVSPVDFCICGGDIIASEADSLTAEQALYYLSYFDQMCRKTFGADKYLPMAGNHDYNYTSGDVLTEDNLVNAMFRKWGKAYYKYKANNSTVYLLNTGRNYVDGSGYDVPMDEYKWGQIDWLGNALIEDDPEHAIVAMHIIRNNNTEQPEFRLFINANALADAYNNHTTITLNNVTYDFSGCTGRVELFLGGHLHNDETFDFSKNDIPCIMRSNTLHNNVNPTFDMILCDWENRTVYFKKIGNGNDMTVDLDNFGS